MCDSKHVGNVKGKLQEIRSDKEAEVPGVFLSLSFSFSISIPSSELRFDHLTFNTLADAPVFTRQRIPLPVQVASILFPHHIKAEHLSRAYSRHGQTSARDPYVASYSFLIWLPELEEII